LCGREIAAANEWTMENYEWCGKRGPGNI